MAHSFPTLSYNINGIETVVKAIGDGPAVFAMHGAATLEGLEFARDLADRFRVFLPSHSGLAKAAPCRISLGCRMWWCIHRVSSIGGRSCGSTGISGA